MVPRANPSGGSIVRRSGSKRRRSNPFGRRGKLRRAPARWSVYVGGRPIKSYKLKSAAIRFAKSQASKLGRKVSVVDDRFGKIVASFGSVKRRGRAIVRAANPSRRRRKPVRRKVARHKPARKTAARRKAGRARRKASVRRVIRRVLSTDLSPSMYALATGSQTSSADRGRVRPEVVKARASELATQMPRARHFMEGGDGVSGYLWFQRKGSGKFIVLSANGSLSEASFDRIGKQLRNDFPGSFTWLNLD